MRLSNYSCIPFAIPWRQFRKLLLSAMLLVGLGQAAAQQKEVKQDEQLWLGYMTTTRIAARYSIWNDAHHIPGGFGIIRTGLVRHFANRIDVTAGYAHGWLPIAGELRRHEHRPWAQVVLPTPLGNNFSLQHRLRWDLRYRQRIAGSELVDGYTFNHRSRVQAVLRKNFPQLEFNGVMPSLVLADELLINLGKEVAQNTFDQNRISLMAAMRYKGLMLQAGYMNRFVQSTTAGRYTSYHTLVFWLFHNIDLSKQEPPR